jgi:hypothetical protein
MPANCTGAPIARSASPVNIQAACLARRALLDHAPLLQTLKHLYNGLIGCQSHYPTELAHARRNPGARNEIVNMSQRLNLSGGQFCVVHGEDRCINPASLT